MEIIADDPSIDQAVWLERADLVGQVWGSSPHGPTIPKIFMPDDSHRFISSSPRRASLYILQSQFRGFCKF